MSDDTTAELKEGSRWQHKNDASGSHWLIRNKRLMFVIDAQEFVAAMCMQDVMDGVKAGIYVPCDPSGTPLPAKEAQPAAREPAEGQGALDQRLDQMHDLDLTTIASSVAAKGESERQSIITALCRRVEKLTPLKSTSECAALGKRVGELEGVAGALHKTADGVHIVPGMRVWVMSVPIDSGEVISVNTWGAQVSRSSSIVWKLPNELWASEAAARAALAGGGE